jgi:chemotaxis signal transduction protein
MSAAALVPGSEARAIRDRNGVRVPVFSLADPAGAQPSKSADALVVLALADRMAAVAVDAVCEVRIARERSNAAAHAGPSLAQSIGWIALWEGTEVPVLDVAAWLDVTYATALEPAVS